MKWPQPTPDIAEAPPGTYRVKLLVRCTLAGTRYRAGAVLAIAPDKLRVASHLCKTGAARPDDPATARDVALHLALDAALPR